MALPTKISPRVTLSDEGNIPAIEIKLWIHMAAEIDHEMETLKDLSGEVQINIDQPVYAGPYSIVYHGRMKSNNQLVRTRCHRTSRFAQWLLPRSPSKR